MRVCARCRKFKLRHFYPLTYLLLYGMIGMVKCSDYLSFYRVWVKAR